MTIRCPLINTVFHRRDTKNTECLIDYIKEFLCVFCVSAVIWFFGGVPSGNNLQGNFESIRL